MRLFYAVFLPPEVQKALAEAQKRLDPFKGWKKTPPHQLHLTLLFLGEVPEEEVEGFLALGRRLARAVPPFTARIRGTGYFPAEGSPRVWFAKAEGEGFLRLAEGLRAEAPDPDPKPFAPHITLARKKGPAPRVGPVVLGLEFPVEEFALVQSVLRPKGPEYRILERFPLRGEHERGKAEVSGEHPEGD
jgi:2'-5' RNA ligase